MTNIAETAYQKLQTLPIDLQLQALDFIEFIGQKSTTHLPLGNIMTDSSANEKRKLGFMRDQGRVPESINWGDTEIENLFDKNSQEPL